MFLRRLLCFLSAAFAVFAFCGCSKENSTDVYVDNTGSNSWACENVQTPNSKITDSAQACIVYCADNCRVLYGHDIHEKRPIASITKIMTAIICLEYAAANDKAVRITEQMYAEGSSMYLKAGEIIRLSELVKGMLAVSGNDAANAAAIAVAGSKEAFAELMNQKAADLGMKNTHFVTPSGLDDSQHYSSAYDMALLCSYAMEKESFCSIVSEQNLIAEYIYPEGKTQHLHNHNRLLSVCPGCIGIKTGFTKKAGRTLTSCAERDGIRLVAVTLDDGNDWQDHCSLYDNCFKLVKKVMLCSTDEKITVPLVGGTEKMIKLVPERELYAVVETNEKEQPDKVISAPGFIYAPAVKGRRYGKIEFRQNGRIIASCRLVSEKK